MTLHPLLLKSSQSVLYAPSAFFFYPWKPFFNELIGDTYEVAYRHFRRDHSDSGNMLLHFVCLFLQLVGNFGLLGTLNEVLLPALPPLHLPLHLRTNPLALVTATTWMVYLALASRGAPRVAVALSAACIACALCAAPVLEAAWVDLGSMLLFLASVPAAAAFRNKALKRRKVLLEVAADVFSTLWKYLLFLAALGPQGTHLGQMRTGFGATSEGASPLLAEHRVEAAAAFAVVLLTMSALPKPVKPVTVVACLGSRLMYALTGEVAWRWFACGSTGMILQGTAHGISRQEATLLNIEGEEDADLKLRFEWAHCTFFPCVLWHSAGASLSEARGRRERGTVGTKQG